MSLETNGYMTGELHLLTGRIAVICGATKNIGLATARRFAASGASLVISSRTQSDLDRVRDDLLELGAPEVVAIAADIRNAEEVGRLITATRQQLGGADIIVNNALISMGHQDVLETPPEIWSEGLNGYIEGPLALIRGLRSSMAARGHGAVVNVVTTAAFSTVECLGAYGIMKSAMWTMTRYLAKELAPEIRVNAVCPGTTSADGTPGDNERWKRLLSKVPLARMASPYETANAVLFLASDMSSYTTGDVVFVDGGRTALDGT